jgi:hypothetical protein
MGGIWESPRKRKPVNTTIRKKEYLIEGIRFGFVRLHLVHKECQSPDFSS